ncbi:MAG: hemerythrin family protein [Magnetospirillum sp.]|nr:hemerythrin family protein [Magnetospirillum sp.]
MDSMGDTCSVGNALLDADHEILLDLLRQLDDAVETGQTRDVVASVVNVLVEYAGYHFRREEAILAQSGFPDIEDHGRQHQALEKSLFSVKEQCLAGKWEALCDDARARLKNELTEHMLVTDKSYRPWVSKETGGQAAGAEVTGEGKGRPCPKGANCSQRNSSA